MPKITLRLDSKSIEAAIKRVEVYKNDLPNKCEKIRQRVTEILLEQVKTGFNGAIYDDVLLEGMKVPDVNVYVGQDGKISLVIAEGSEAVFCEFGAGVYYNPGGSLHPNLYNVQVVGIGEYGKGYGSRQVWGYYEGGKTDDPEENKKRLRLTHGTPASMPMYHAAKAVREVLPEIVREVFQEGGHGR